MLPASLVFIERDWLSSNHLVACQRGTGAVVVDTGYSSRSALTVALIERALGGVAVERIVNTHTHSDHIGGNAALAARHHCRILIPAGARPAVADWDEERLLLAPLGQVCERFDADGTFTAGDRIEIGGLEWQAIGSPGHDNDSLVLFEPRHRLLLSADALWENGFGVLFPAFFDEPAFDHQAETLGRIAALDIDLVLPGHGPMFSDVPGALDRARRRLAYFQAQPHRHARSTLKVVLSFLLLDRRLLALERLEDEFGRLALVERINARHFGATPARLATAIRDELIAAGAARIDGGTLVPAR
jgi:glyoxylase-like metal-dependent hydrolase (beta-lactamase superfamily II)